MFGEMMMTMMMMMMRMTMMMMMMMMTTTTTTTTTKSHDTSNVPKSGTKIRFETDVNPHEALGFHLSPLGFTLVPWVSP